MPCHNEGIMGSTTGYIHCPGYVRSMLAQDVTKIRTPEKVILTQIKI